MIPPDIEFGGRLLLLGGRGRGGGGCYQPRSSAKKTKNNEKKKSGKHLLKMITFEVGIMLRRAKKNAPCNATTMPEFWLWHGFQILTRSEKLSPVQKSLVGSICLVRVWYKIYFGNQNIPSHSRIKWMILP